MKSIHKKIIQLQARAMTKSLKWIKNPLGADNQHRIALEENGDRILYRENNRRFMPAKQTALNMPPAAQAKLLRTLFFHDSHRHHRNNQLRHCPYALWYHGNTYSSKEAVAEYVKLKKERKAITPAAIEKSVLEYRLKNTEIFRGNLMKKKELFNARPEDL